MSSIFVAVNACTEIVKSFCAPPPLAREDHTAHDALDICAALALRNDFTDTTAHLDGLPPCNGLFIAEMVPYNKDKEPSIWQFSSSSIQASLIFDQAANTTYTNLDEISGRVILRCAKAVNITSIVVKLEGESKTRLLGTSASSHKQDPKPFLEYHKVRLPQ